MIFSNKKFKITWYSLWSFKPSKFWHERVICVHFETLKVKMEIWEKCYCWAKSDTVRYIFCWEITDTKRRSDISLKRYRDLENPEKKIVWVRGKVSQDFLPLFLIRVSTKAPVKNDFTKFFVFANIYTAKFKKRVSAKSKDTRTRNFFFRYSDFHIFKLLLLDALLENPAVK